MSCMTRHSNSPDRCLCPGHPTPHRMICNQTLLPNLARSRFVSWVERTCSSFSLAAEEPAPRPLRRHYFIGNHSHFLRRLLQTPNEPALIWAYSELLPPPDCHRSWASLRATSSGPTRSCFRRPTQQQACPDTYPEEPQASTRSEASCDWSAAHEYWQYSFAGGAGCALTRHCRWSCSSSHADLY